MPIRGANWFAVSAEANSKTCSEDSGNDESSDCLGDLVRPPAASNDIKDRSSPDAAGICQRRCVSGRFIVESVQQLPEPCSSVLPVTAWKTTSQQRTPRTMSESHPPGLKSILKTMRSVSASHSSDDDVQTYRRRKRVSFSEIVTEQLYPSEQQCPAESNRKKSQKNKANQTLNKRRQKDQNKTKPAFGKKRSRNRQYLAEPYKQLKSQIPQSIFELVSSYPVKTTNDHESVAIENEWTEVTYRRPGRKQKHLKRQDSEASDESGFGSLPSSLDESQGNNLSLPGFFIEGPNHFTACLGNYEDSRHQEVNLIVNRLLDVTISQDTAVRGKNQ